MLTPPAKFKTKAGKTQARGLRRNAKITSRFARTGVHDLLSLQGDH